MERDEQNFEKALARRLRSDERSEARSDAQTDTRANEPPSSALGASVEECPDAEVLAAYHERSLSEDELGRYKQHVSGCARCQEILAQLETTEEIVLDEREEMLAARSVVGSLRAVPKLAAASPAERSMSRNALQKPIGIDAAKVRPRNALWKTYVPMGTIAAGLALWFFMHGRIDKTLVTEPNQVAENRPEPQATNPAPIIAEDKLRDRNGMEPSSGSAVAPNVSRTGAASGGLRSPGTPIPPRTRAGYQPANPGARSQSLQQQQASAGVQTSYGATTTEGKTKSEADKNASADAVARREDQSNLANQMVNESAGRAAANAPVAQPPSPTTPQMDATAKTRQTYDGASVTAAAPVPVVGVNAKAMARVDAKKLIVASGGVVMWRVGLRGLIEQSGDSGQTWRIQFSGTEQELLAGSAPSGSVCWVGGRSGTLLQTTDGGGHWNKVLGPETRDWGAVHAVSALRATISDVTNKISYETSDGGITWQRSSAE